MMAALNGYATEEGVAPSPQSGSTVQLVPGPVPHEAEFLNVPLLDPQVGSFIDGMVSVADSPSMFYVQPLVYEEHVVLLTTRLNYFYEQLDPEDMAVTPGFINHPGELCAAKFPDDNVWYRATYLERVSPTKAKVHFVDYGNVATVPLASMKKLLRNMRQMPRLSLICADEHAAAIDPDAYTQRIEGNPVVLRFNGMNESGQHVVTVFETDGSEETNVSKELAGTLRNSDE